MAGLSLAALLGSLFLWSAHVDAQSRDRDEVLLRQGVVLRIAEIEGQIAPLASWDTAISRLDDAPDRIWLRSDLAAELAQTTPIDSLYVLDSQDRPLPAPQARGSFLRQDAARLAAARPLIREVRDLQNTRDAQPDAGALRRARPLQASGFIIAEGRALLATATVIRTTADEAPSRGAILLTVQLLEPSLLAPLRARYQLDALSAGPDQPAKKLASTRFATVSGAPINFTWMPAKPGSALLKAAAAPLWIAILAFCAIGAIMVRRTRLAAQNLIDAHHFQGEFMANLSHEIRTPLNGVVAVAGVLERTELTPRQAELVHIIRSSGQTLQRLLSDVLDVNRIQTGGLSLETAPFNLADTLASAAELARPLAEEKGVELVTEIPQAAHTTVLGDVVRLKQILTNLLSNAVKFTHEGRVVLRLGEGWSPDVWRIEVEDTGVGFDPARAEAIFGRYQQADASVTRRFGGSGLGLAICRQLAELMGGQISCDSSPGQGSTFVVEVPLPRTAAALVQAATPPPVQATAEGARAQARSPAGPQAPATFGRAPRLDPDRLEAPARAESQPPAALRLGVDEDEAPSRFEDRPLRVLLADDHPTNRTVVQVMVGHLGVDLVTVENGQQACEAFEAHPFDVVLMDMQMPVMDGVTAVRRIRLFEQLGRRAPAYVVMLTANALPEHEELSSRAGADVHLAKPIEASKLVAALQAGAERAIEAAEAPTCDVRTLRAS